MPEGIDERLDICYVDDGSPDAPVIYVRVGLVNDAAVIAVHDEMIQIHIRRAGAPIRSLRAAG